MARSGRRHFGSARQLPSGRWQATYWHEGAHYSAPGTFLTKTAALQFLSGTETELHRGTWIAPDAGRISVSELAARWLASNPAKRPDTIATDEYHLRVHLLPWLGQRRISSVTAAEVQTLVNHLSERLAPRTVARSFGVLRAVFAFAVASDLIGKSPCRGVRLPRAEIGGRYVPSPEEVARLATNMEPRYRPMVYLGAICGLRFSEVAGLRVGRLDLVVGALHVMETVTRDGKGAPVFGPPKSKASQRTVALPETLVAVLRAHLTEMGLSAADPCGLVFPAPDGGPLRYANWRNRVWVPACTAAELEGLGFHSLRRASATALVLNGVDLKTAQVRLGHSDPRLTLLLYAQAVADADRSAAELLAARFLPVAASGPSISEPRTPARHVPVKSPDRARIAHGTGSGHGTTRTASR